MSIIDKLGIENIDYLSSAFYKTKSGFVDHKEVNKHPMGKVMEAAPEMLEALIYCYYDNEEDPTYESVKIIIEKASGKSWEEIKQLL